MTVSASAGRGDRHRGWYGLSGTAGSQDPALPPLPDVPRQRGRDRGRHTSGVPVTDLVLRDDTGELPTTGAIITSSGRMHRHAAPLTMRRGTTATRVTTAAVLVGGTAVGVIGAVAGPSFLPPVDDSPLHSPVGPDGVTPIPGAPGSAVTAAPGSVAFAAFSTTAESLGLGSGGPLAGGPLAGTTSLPGATAAPAPGVLTPGAGGTATTPGGGTGGGGGLIPTIPVPLPGGGSPGGGSPGGGGGGGGTSPGGTVPLVPIVGGGVVDTGNTVKPLPVVGPVVGGVTDTVGGATEVVQNEVVAPVGATTGGVVDTVGTVAAPVPVVGGATQGLTNTVSDVTTIVTGGGQAPSGPGVAGAAGTLLEDAGTTVGAVAPPLAGTVPLTTSTASQFVQRTAETATAPVTDTVEAVGSAAEDVPAVGPTVKKTTDTVSNAVGTLVNGASSGSSSSGSSSSDSNGSSNESSGDEDSGSSSSSSSDGGSSDSSSSDEGSGSGESGSGSSSGGGDLVSTVTGAAGGLLGGR